MTQPDVFQNDYLKVVESAHRALSSTEAPYCVIGALALGVWGTPRATYDVDFLSELSYVLQAADTGR